MYAAVSGADGRDGVCSSPRTSIDHVLASTAAHSLSGVCVGIPLECHVEGLSRVALSSWRDAAAALVCLPNLQVRFSSNYFVRYLLGPQSSTFRFLLSRPLSQLIMSSSARKPAAISLAMMGPGSATKNLSKLSSMQCQDSTGHTVAPHFAQLHSDWRSFCACAAWHSARVLALLLLSRCLSSYPPSFNTAAAGAAPHSRGNIRSEQQTVFNSFRQSAAAAVSVVQTSRRCIFQMPRNFAPYVGGATPQYR